MNETRELARYVADATYEALPQRVIDLLKIYALDNLASAFAGLRTPWAEAVVGLVSEDSAAGPCTLFGRSAGTTPTAAAFANGVMIGGFETDHTYSPGSCHPSASVFPATLAIAERDHLDGRAFLTAMAAGYEVLCRIGAAAGRGVEDERGFHGPGTNAAFGAAMGAGKAMGVSQAVLINALGIAGSSGAGLLEFFVEGAMTKRLHIGRGSQLGLESLLLAQRGVTGPSTVLEGEHGFLHVYSPSPKLELLLQGLGERYLLEQVQVKSFPCHISFHAVIEALQVFRQAHSFEPQTIQSIAIRGSHRIMEERFGNRCPATILGAQYSLPWAAALALTRDVGDPRAWSETDLVDTSLQRIAALTELTEESGSFGGEGQPVAAISLNIGGTMHELVAGDWKGAPTNRYSYADMAQKFELYAGAYLASSDIAEMVERVEHLEAQDLADVAMIMRRAAVV